VIIRKRTSRHRGLRAEDKKLFDSQNLERLQRAAHDLCLLVDRGYSFSASLKLVGDHFKLKKRQREALGRVVFGRKSVERRTEKLVSDKELAGQTIAIDFFNQQIVLESLLSGAFVFLGRDGFYRDLAGIHGSFRRVIETHPALDLMGVTLSALKVQKALIYLDRPVSNSKKMANMINGLASENSWSLEAIISNRVDQELIESGLIICSSDSHILDNCGRAFNLLEYIHHTHPQNFHSDRFLNFFKLTT